MQSNSRTYVSVVSTLLMVVMTVLLAAYFPSHSANAAESAPTSVIAR